MMDTTRRGVLHAGAALGAALGTGLISRPVRARTYRDPGVTDKVIRIGGTFPFSGPASAYGVIGTTDKAYFDMVNEQGGINGRKIELVALDDAYSPPKTVEAMRRLVEEEQVLFLFNSVGTAANSAVAKYLTAKKVPSIFITSGASKWGDAKEFPWTIGFQAPYSAEGEILAKHVLAHVKDPKIGVLMQNDDFGKDYYNGFVKGIGNKDRIVSMVTYEISDPTVDSQMVQLKSSGANVFVNITSPKFAAQSIRKFAEIQWNAAHYLNSTVTSMPTLKAAGLDKCNGLISLNYAKDPTDPQWQDDKDFKDYAAFMTKYNKDVSVSEGPAVFAYAASFTLHQVLKQCGDDLSRENVMRQATSLKDLTVPMLLPGVRINTSATDHFPIQTVHMMTFEGQRWKVSDESLST